MNFQLIVKILSAILGLSGTICLFILMGSGDETIKMNASQGDFSVVSPLISIAQVTLFLTVAATLIFSLKALFANSEKLKKALIFVGIFIFIVGVAYVSSSGVETPLKDGKFLSESGSRWVETGIRTFYILSISAILSMAFSGVKRLIK
jgi:predicted membrane channel-forming protein YqfA (hemolysin III family)